MCPLFTPLSFLLGHTYIQQVPGDIVYVIGDIITPSLLFLREPSRSFPLVRDPTLVWCVRDPWYVVQHDLSTCSLSQGSGTFGYVSEVFLKHFDWHQQQQRVPGTREQQQ